MGISKGLADEQPADSRRMSTCVDAHEPLSPLAKFCRDKLTSSNGCYYHDKTIHTVDLKEALEIERPRVVEALTPKLKPPKIQRSSSAAGLHVDTKSKFEPKGAPMDFLRSPMHYKQLRRLSLIEKDVNVQKAVSYFSKVQETNELSAQIRSGARNRSSSMPCLHPASKDSSDTKGSKDSTQVPRKESKGRAPDSKDSTQVPRKDSKEGQKEAAIAAKAKMLKALGMAAPRPNLLAASAVKAFETAAQPEPEKKGSKMGAIGGSMMSGKNTLLQRLKAKQAMLATME